MHCPFKLETELDKLGVAETYVAHHYFKLQLTHASLPHQRKIMWPKIDFDLSSAGVNYVFEKFLSLTWLDVGKYDRTVKLNEKN